MSSQQAAIDPLFDPEIVQNPHDYYRYLRENDPVHQVVGTTCYLITRADLIYEVVGRPEVFSSVSGKFLHRGDWAAPGLLPPTGGYADGESAGGGVAGADPPDHGRQRKVVSRKLSTANMRAMEPEFRILVDEALSKVPPDGRFEWMGRVAEPLPMVMVARILGLSDELAPQLKKQGYASVERISGFVSDARIRELDGDRITDLLPVIEAYTHAKEDSGAYSGGMLGILARAVVDGELSDTEAVGILGVLIAAGGESTTSLTGTSVRILAERRDLQDRLRSSPELIPAFVEEACRFDPPFRGHYRRTRQDVELAGVSIPAESQIVLMWSAANRDPAEFDHPEEVHLDRPNPRHHLGFGWGIHLCVGAPLARVEAKVAIETLLDRTRSFELDPDASPLRYHASLMVRRLVELPLLLEVAQ
jgi:cytochrome P450